MSPSVMADVKVNPHSFAAVISRLELNGYLTPCHEDEGDDELPLPNAPVASYERTDSMSSTSQDSFYTLYDELPSDVQSGTATPRTFRAEKGSDSVLLTEVAANETVVDEFTIIEPPEDRSVDHSFAVSGPINMPPARIHIESPPRERRISAHETQAPILTMGNFDDVITEEELQRLEDEIAPRIQPRSKDLAKIFGQDPNHTYYQPQQVDARREDVDAMLIDEEYQFTPQVIDEEPPQASHLGDLRKKLAWRPTAASSEQKEADKRDFAKLVLGEDGALADKLFGNGQGADADEPLDVRRKPTWKLVAGSEKERAADERDFAELMRNESEAQRADKLFGARVRAHAKLRKAPLGPPTIPPRASSAIHATNIVPSESPEATPRTSDLTITDTITTKSLISEPGQPSIVQGRDSPPRSRPSTATSSVVPPSTVDSVETSDFRSFSDVFAPEPPAGSSGQVKRLTAYHDSPPAESEASSISDSSTTASDVSDSEMESPSIAAPESPLSDAESDTDTATDAVSYKTSMSLSSLSESVISTQDLSARPAHLSTSTPSLRRAFDRSLLPLRSSSARSPSLDSAAPPPISLVRPETPPRTPRRRPLGGLFRRSTPTSPTSSIRRGGRSPPPPVPKIDPVAAAAARAEAERELLDHSVPYEAAAPRPTPFTSKHAAGVFPRRKHRQERVHLGREVLEEHELLEAIELAQRMHAIHEARAAEQAERLAADVVQEMLLPPPPQRRHGHGFSGPMPASRRPLRASGLHHGLDPFVEQGHWDHDERRASKRLSALVEEEDGD